jgi:hypothetical protein
MKKDEGGELVRRRKRELKRIRKWEEDVKEGNIM